MHTYTLLWEKGTKHDLKSLGRQAADKIRFTGNFDYCFDQPPRPSVIKFKS
jgi:hypothetical protein